MMTGRKATGIWLLLGLGWKLQVIASLSITEIVVLACAPFIFVKNYRKMKRDGVMPLFILSLLVVFGCIVASLANHTQMQYVLRGLAVTCIVSCSIIFSHWILRLDPGGFRWFVLTMPISVMLSTFVFRTAVETTMLGETAEEIMGGPIFWISRLKPLVLAPTKGWYLQMPWFVNMAAPIFMAVFSVITSVSGRSAALATIGFAAFVLIGGKSRKSMSRIARHFWLLCGGGVLLVFAMYCGYKFSASQGLLGEDARKKYEAQTHGG